MFVCQSAARLPSVIDATEATITRSGQATLMLSPELSVTEYPSPNASRKRTKSANPAAFDATDRNAVNGVGAPSYTSGHQKCIGNAAILYARPANAIPAAARSVGAASPPAANFWARSLTCRLPVRP